MDLKYPIFLYIGIPVLVAGLVVMHIFGRRRKYKGGRRVANTRFFRGLAEYEGQKQLRRVLAVVLEVCIIGSLISSLILAARPYRTETTSNGVKKRDIFLCLDVSYSICYLNYDLVDSLEEVVAGLKGDRFGILIFNTSSVLYVPMTDDYDFIRQKLEDLKEYFRLQKIYQDETSSYDFGNTEDYMKMREVLDYYDAGTLVNNYTKGSSLIGEGLASCVYSFPRLASEDRTRLIIMATDNAEMALSTPLVELDGAVDLCIKNHIKMFGLFPDQETYDKGNYSDYTTDMSEFQAGVERTGGTFYQQSKTLTVEDIVADIQRQEALEVDELIITKEIDQPEAFVIVLLVCLTLGFGAGVVLKS